MNTKITQLKKHTGRNLVLLNSSLKRDLFFKATQNASIRMAHFNDFALHPEKLIEAFTAADGIYFEMLNVAVINFDREDEIGIVNRELSGKAILSVEPERYVYKIGKRSKSNHASPDFPGFSWGIKATGVDETPFTGKGVNIAILDTGVFKTHEDLKGRKIKTKKFVSTGSAGDVDGHGSHCTGIACGFKDKDGFRYGVACESNIFVGKVLDDDGVGTDGGILAGIEWALTNKCSVISMSLGAASQPGEPYSETYESVAGRAVKKGSLIIAAAGNESNRPSYVAPVGHPANCPSIMAVGAIDSSLKIAPFSCGGTKNKGGQVDIAAPGVSVYSMINEQGQHEKWDGTSMATPFVSGIAGLFFEENKKSGPLGVWAKITQQAKRLKLSSVDAGSGLVQAP